jgi:hypothetical protein
MGAFDASIFRCFRLAQSRHGPGQRTSHYLRGPQRQRDHEFSVNAAARHPAVPSIEDAASAKDDRGCGLRERRQTALAFTAVSMGHRVLSSEDASSANATHYPALDVGMTRCVPSPSPSVQSIAPARNLDRKFKPVALEQNEAAADPPTQFLKFYRWRSILLRKLTARGRKHHAQIGAPSPQFVSDYLATPDGIRLTEAFMQIPNARLRRSIVNLVERSPVSRKMMEAQRHPRRIE